MFYRKYLDRAVTCKTKTAMPDLRFSQASLLRIHVFLHVILCCWVSVLILCCWVSVSQHFKVRYQFFHLQGLTGLRVVHSSWTPQFCKLKALQFFKML